MYSNHQDHQNLNSQIMTQYPIPILPKQHNFQKHDKVENVYDSIIM
jgi:hypothetical protein